MKVRCGELAGPMWCPKSLLKMGGGFLGKAEGKVGYRDYVRE